VFKKVSISASVALDSSLSSAYPTIRVQMVQPMPSGAGLTAGWSLTKSSVLTSMSAMAGTSLTRGLASTCALFLEQRPTSSQTTEAGYPFSMLAAILGAYSSTKAAHSGRKKDGSSPHTVVFKKVSISASVALDSSLSSAYPTIRVQMVQPMPRGAGLTAGCSLTSGSVLTSMSAMAGTSLTRGEVWAGCSLTRGSVMTSMSAMAGTSLTSEVWHTSAHTWAASRSSEPTISS